MRSKGKRSSTGAVYVEYLIASGVLLLALWVPLPGTDRSAVMQIVEVIRLLFAHSEYWMSLP